MASDSASNAIPLSFPNSGVGGERVGKTLLRERFDSEKDSVIESAMNKGESWAKKVGSGASGVMLDDIPSLIDALNLRIVDKGKVCVDREVYEAYRALARAAVTDIKKLDWEV